MCWYNATNNCIYNIRIIGSTSHSKSLQVKAKILKDIVGIIYLKIESGEVKPTIYKTLPIEKAEEAHALLYNGINIGKVELLVNYK